MSRPRTVPPGAGPLPALTLALAVLSLPAAAPAQDPEVNYDEAKVPAYTLPDPLTLADGQPVADADAWTGRRRPEVVALFESQVYGKAPGRPEGMTFETTATVPDALDGKATRKHITIHFDGSADGPALDLMLYVPNGGDGPYPVVLGLNFGGNHTVDPDPSIPLTRSWVREGDHRATEESRGAASSRWPVGRILDRGYALATGYYGDIDPDFDDGFNNGVHALFPDTAGPDRPADAWGSIAAWAWGLRRAADYLETDPDLDKTRIILMGHSRLGKTALWAGAQDERFAVVISNDSGAGGAALSRRRFGETVARLNSSFPHWFADNFNQYSDHEDDLPIDQHELMALVAPRPLLVCSATEDLWADPRGEFLSAAGADPVYRLLGTDGLAVRDMPGPRVLVRSRLGYHLRPGKHDVTAEDWDAYLDFADRHLGRPNGTD